jgi:hypothetical protein
MSTLSIKLYLKRSSIEEQRLINFPSVLHDSNCLDTLLSSTSKPHRPLAYVFIYSLSQVQKEMSVCMGKERKRQLTKLQYIKSHQPATAK